MQPPICADARDQHCKRAFFRGDEKADRTFVAIDLLVVSHVPLRAAGGTIAAKIMASTGFHVFFDVFPGLFQVSQLPLFLKLNRGLDSELGSPSPAFQLRGNRQPQNHPPPARLPAQIRPPNPSQSQVPIPHLPATPTDSTNASGKIEQGSPTL